MIATRLFLTAALASAACTPSDPQPQRSLDKIERDVTDAISNGFLADRIEAARLEPVDPVVTQELVDALMAMAAQEPCNIEGGLAGTMAHGELRLAAMRSGGGMSALLRGYIQPRDSGDESFSGTYKTARGFEGELEGLIAPTTPAPPPPLRGEAISEPIGEIYGAYVDERGATGDLFAVWTDHGDGAIVLGGYAMCEGFTAKVQAP